MFEITAKKNQIIQKGKQHTLSYKNFANSVIDAMDTYLQKYGNNQFHSRGLAAQKIKTLANILLAIHDEKLATKILFIALLTERIRIKAENSYQSNLQSLIETILVTELNDNILQDKLTDYNFAKNSVTYFISDEENCFYKIHDLFNTTEICDDDKIFLAKLTKNFFQAQWDKEIDRCFAKDPELKTKHWHTVKQSFKFKTTLQASYDRFEYQLSDTRDDLKKKLTNSFLMWQKYRWIQALSILALEMKNMRPFLFLIKEKAPEPQLMQRTRRVILFVPTQKKDIAFHPGSKEPAKLPNPL